MRWRDDLFPLVDKSSKKSRSSGTPSSRSSRVVGRNGEEKEYIDSLVAAGMNNRFRVWYVMME